MAQGTLEIHLSHYEIFPYVFEMSAIERTASCDERIRLLVEYQRATAEYSAAVGDLAARIISVSEYKQLSASAKTARQASIDARERLERHIAEHHC